MAFRRMYDDIFHLLLKTTTPTEKTLELVSDALCREKVLFRDTEGVYCVRINFHVLEESNGTTFHADNKAFSPISKIQVLLFRESSRNHYGDPSFLISNVATSHLTADSPEILTTVFKMPYFDTDATSQKRAHAFYANGDMWKQITEKLMDIVLICLRINYGENKYADMHKDEQVKKIQTIFLDLNQMQVKLFDKIINAPQQGLTFEIDPIFATLFTESVFCEKVSEERLDVERIVFEEHETSYVLHMFSVMGVACTRFLQESSYAAVFDKRWSELNRYQSVDDSHWGSNKNLFTKIKTVLSCYINYGVRFLQTSPGWIPECCEAAIDCMKRGVIVQFADFFKVKETTMKDRSEQYGHLRILDVKNDEYDNIMIAFDACRQSNVAEFRTAIQSISDKNLLRSLCKETLLGKIAQKVELSEMESNADYVHALSVQADMVDILYQRQCNLNVLLPFTLEGEKGYKNIFVTFLTMWEHCINFPALEKESKTNPDKNENFKRALFHHSQYKFMGAVATPWSAIVPFSDSLEVLDPQYRTQEFWQEYTPKNNDVREQEDAPMLPSQTSTLAMSTRISGVHASPPCVPLSLTCRWSP